MSGLERRIRAIRLDAQLFCGQQPPHRSRFKPLATSSSHKPDGGLWTSTWRPQDGGSSWVDYAARVGRLSEGRWLMHPPLVRVLTIDDEADALAVTQAAPFQPGWATAEIAALAGPWVDWSALAGRCDAVHMTYRGMLANRHGGMAFVTWDAESTLWLRWPDGARVERAPAPAGSQIGR